MADNFDVFVDFAMNEEGNKKVVSGAVDIQEELKKLEDQAKKTGRALQDVLVDNIDNLRKWSDQAQREILDVKKAQQDQAAEAARSARAQGAIFSAQASHLLASTRALRMQSEELQRIQSQVNTLSRTALVAGTALTLGIFKIADEYVKNAPEATQLTREWEAAQEDLNESMSRVGKVAAEAALPILQKVAELAEQTASFIETHPGLVRAALNVGIITAGLGALGILVSRGIKMYADVLYLQAVPAQAKAAQLQFLASEQMLVAAKLQAEASGVDVVEDLPLPGAKGLGGKAGPFLALLGEGAVLLGSFAAGLIVADKAFDAIEGRDVKFADYITTFKQTLAIDAKNFGDLLERVKIPFTDRNLFQADTGEQMFRDAAVALGLLQSKSDDAANSIEDLAGTIEGSKAFEQILSTYEKYREDDLKLVEDHYAERKEITANGLQEELEANARYAFDVKKVQASTSSAITDLAKSYSADLIKAEQKLAQDRADVLQDATEDIKKIEEQLQETLRKNRLDHEDRLQDLVSKRDALGLVRENRRYEQLQAEERRQANLEIRRRRADLAQRLQELEVEFAQERAARYQEYVQRAVEIRTQAAERLKEMQIQHQEEMKKIREQTTAKLREEDARFAAERKRRYDYFIQQIRDLDASLLGERNLRLQYQQQMIDDLNGFLAKYRAGLASMKDAVPGKASGDYTSGLVMTGEKGYEWIATHNSTKAAENIIGGRLTQETFVQAMRALQASRQATYVDNRRLEVPMNRETKQAYKQGAMEALQEMFGGT